MYDMPDLTLPAPRELSFVVPGQPIPWGVHTRFESSESKARLKTYQEMVRVAARLAMEGFPPHKGRVILEIGFYLQIPDSAGKRPATRDRWMARHQLMKPDTTNLQKAAEDGLTEQAIKGVPREQLGIIFIDDNQVTDVKSYKRFTDEEPRTQFFIQLL